jgi:hypothetical protein
VRRAVVARGVVELIEPQPVRVLGMDETRFGRPRWLPDGHHEDGRVRWRRTDPWETGFVDIIGEQGLWGQVDAPTSAAVAAWLAARSQEFRDAVEVVVIDPHAGYAEAVRAALARALLAVDHFHLVMLANEQGPHRRAPARDPRAVGPARASDRPGLGQPSAVVAWTRTAVPGGVGPDVERVRRSRSVRADPDRLDRQGIVAGTVCHRGRRRRPRRHQPAAVGVLHLVRRRRVPELTTLAETIDTCWPAVEVSLTTGLSNARTEGTNRLIKQVKRAARGFRNRENYRRRVRLHRTRHTRRLSARKPTVPA